MKLPINITSRPMDHHHLRPGLLLVTCIQLRQAACLVRISSSQVLVPVEEPVVLLVVEDPVVIIVKILPKFPSSVLLDEQSAEALLLGQHGLISSQSTGHQTGSGNNNNLGAF